MPVGNKLTPQGLSGRRMPKPTAEREKSPHDLVKEFLRYQSQAPLKAQPCARCGALLAYILTQFQLDGEEEIWSIPLAYCLNCHPELLARIAYLA